MVLILRNSDVIPLVWHKKLYHWQIVSLMNVSLMCWLPQMKHIALLTVWSFVSLSVICSFLRPKFIFSISCCLLFICESNFSFFPSFSVTASLSMTPFISHFPLSFHHKLSVAAVVSISFLLLCPPLVLLSPYVPFFCSLLVCLNIFLFPCLTSTSSVCLSGYTHTHTHISFQHNIHNEH